MRAVVANGHDKRRDNYALRVISRELARELQPYLRWQPSNGDEFFIPQPEIADSVFLVSDMVVELVTRDNDTRFHFNGTVEWALDSVQVGQVIWLPREDQLRTLLGAYFLSLDAGPDGFVVTVSGPGRAMHTPPERAAADAYARALLHVVGQGGSPADDVQASNQRASNAR